MRRVLPASNKSKWYSPEFQVHFHRFPLRRHDNTTSANRANRSNKGGSHRVSCFSCEHTPFANRGSFLVIPGLGGGHAYGSFQDSDSEFMWLLDWLPIDQPLFRIMTYGYNTTIPGSDSVQDLEALATNFRASLATVRVRSSVSCYFTYSFCRLLT